MTEEEEGIGRMHHSVVRCVMDLAEAFAALRQD